MTTETMLPELVGTLAELPEHIQKVIKAYGAACYRTALQSLEVQALQRMAKTLDEKIESYERYGPICEFEGEPMIHAAHLEELRAAME